MEREIAYEISRENNESIKYFSENPTMFVRRPVYCFYSARYPQLYSYVSARKCQSAIYLTDGLSYLYSL